MRHSVFARAVVVAVLAGLAAGSLLISAAGAAHGHQARSAACAPGDTSGSCRLQSKNVTVDFNACPQTTSCSATVISIKKDANHPYGVQIVLPTTSGTVPAKQSTPQKGVFTILLPPATQAKSIQPGFHINVAEDPSGVFTLQVTDAKGHRVAIWTPPLKLVPPVGYKYLQTLTRAGWVRTNYNRVQTPGLYRWVKS